MMFKKNASVITSKIRKLYSLPYLQNEDEDTFVPVNHYCYTRRGKARGGRHSGYKFCHRSWALSAAFLLLLASRSSVPVLLVTGSEVEQ